MADNRKRILAETKPSDKPKKGRARAVFFDIGNVLVLFDVGHVVRRIAWEVGKHPVRVARFLWKRRLVDGIERGEITASELFAIFKDELQYDGNFDGFARLWCGNFKLNRKSARILHRVARRVPTYLLSNTNRLHYEFIRANYAFPRHVRGAVLSYRLGLRKPEPGIYEEALRRARVSAPEAVFIDDVPENVAAARKLGIKALRFTGASKLEADLARLGVLPGAGRRRAPKA